MNTLAFDRYNIFFSFYMKCGRFITDDIVRAEEAHKLLDVAKKGLAKGGGSGGASILGKKGIWNMNTGQN